MSSHAGEATVGRTERVELMFLRDGGALRRALQLQVSVHEPGASGGGMKAHAWVL